MTDTLKSQSNTVGLANTTMYNLQTKRTLPRDVIKWIQGLDLSYSVKDYRKDLSNGFLIGEIVSRYEPGKIPMHAFQNSNNQSRKDNNWNLLTLFFTKNQLRKVKIQVNQFQKIKTGNDPKSEQLYQFICRLYSVCTKRNLPQGNQTIELPPTQSKNPNLTVSYLLKDDGLQKLDHSQVSINNSNADALEKSNQQRVPTRKISPNIDSPGRVDVKGIGVKQQINRKLTSKKKSWEAKSESFYEQSNPYIQKYTFDYLNEILEQCLNHEGAESIKSTFEKHESKGTETLLKSLPSQPKFLLSFISTVKSSANQILGVMLKDLNEIWKFFIYFIKMLGFFPEDSPEFSHLIDLIVNFAVGANLNEKKKVNKVFIESIIDALISQVKISSSWRKRQKIMEIVYDFSGRQIEDKKAVLFNLKEKLGSSNPLYIYWLAVLVREERSTTNSNLVEDFVYYAHQNLSSPNSCLRISALKILSTVARNGWIVLIDNYFNQQSTMRKIKYLTDFEAIYFASLIYFSLLRNVIDSNQYQTLVKGKNQGNSNTIKVYNPDHEKQTEQIKHRVQSISMTLASLYHNTTSYVTREVIAKESVKFMTESSPLMLIVVYHLASLRDLQEFFKQETSDYQLKTTLASIPPTNIETLKQNANDMIGQLIKLNDEKKAPNIPESADLSLEIRQQFGLMNFCLQNINIKKLNIELWENIGQNFCKIIANSLSDQKFAFAAWSILQKIYLIIFNYDMKMAYLNVWVAEALETVLKNKDSSSQIVQKIKEFFKQQYKNANIQEVKISSDEINDILEEKGLQRLLNLQKKRQ